MMHWTLCIIGVVHHRVAIHRSNRRQLEAFSVDERGSLHLYRVMLGRPSLSNRGEEHARTSHVSLESVSASHNYVIIL